MAKKYIDADYLRKEIEWRLSYIETATGDYAEGRKCELRYLLSIIDVPRQEQPDDICKEGKVECSPIMRELLNKFIEIGNTFNFGFQPESAVEYIRKDVVDETIKSAEDHAYFAGQEKLREKLLELVKNKITEADIAMDTADDPAIWGQKNAFKQVLDKLNSM